MHANQDPQLSSAGCRLSLGGHSYVLQRKDLLLVEHWQPHCPLPWTPGWFRGLVSTAHGPVPLLLAPGQLPDPASPPKLLVVVQTPRGQFAVAADALEELSEAASPDAAGADLAQVLADLAVGLQAAHPRVSAAPRRNQVSPAVQLLRVRSGSKQALVRATDLQQVGRHSGAQLLHPADALHWVVQLDDALLAARSLGVLSHSGVQGSEEPWCLCPATPGAQALLVQEVLGFVEADAAQLRSVRHAGQASHWLVRVPEEPLEILSFSAADTAGGDALPSNVVSLHPVAAAPAQALELEDSPAPGMPGLQPRAALRLTIGPWSVLLPARAVRAVAGRVAPGRLPAQRSARAVPVLDLRRLLGVPLNPRSAQAEPMATLVTLGGRPLLLLSDEVGPAHEPGSAGDEEAWYPLPAAPAALHALLQSARIRSSACELLPQLRRGSALRQPELRQHLIEAWAGWYAEPAATLE